MRVSVVGAGYVGLVTAAGLASKGHHIVCVEQDPERLRVISEGRSPIAEPGLEDLISEAVDSGALVPSSDLEWAVKNTDVSIIAVGTPTKEERIDLSDIVEVSTGIGRALIEKRGFHVVVVKSTAVPGTCEAVVGKTIQAQLGESGSESYGLSVNPEFLRVGHAVSDFLEPDRIVIGCTDDRVKATMGELYAPFTCPFVVTSLHNAELIKYTSNALLATLISFSNEVATVCERIPDGDVDVVLDGLHLDRRLSPIADGERISPGILTYLRAGGGFGGSCLPKDVDALRAFMREAGVEPLLLDAVATVNQRGGEKIVKSIEQTLGALNGNTAAVLGLAFKPGTDDVRSSPAIDLVHRLVDKGVIVKAHDPLAMRTARKELGDKVTYLDSAAEAVRDASFTVIATAWPQFIDLDWHAVAKTMSPPRIIVDTRNCLRATRLPQDVLYQAVGRAN